MFLKRTSSWVCRPTTSCCLVTCLLWALPPFVRALSPPFGLHMHNLISASSQHWVLVAQSCLTLCDSMDSSLPDSSAHGFSRQDCWSGVPFPSPEESSPPRDQTWVSHIADRFLTIWATKEVHLNVVSFQKPHLHYGHSGVGLIIWIWRRMQTFRSAQPSYHIRLRYGWEMKVIQLPDKCQKTRRWWKSLFFFSFNIIKSNQFIFGCAASLFLLRL